MTQNPEIADVEVIEDAGFQVPVGGACGKPVGEIVALAHEETIGEALKFAGVDEAAMDRLLVYCAERRCADESASCLGCRQRSELQGFANVDDFISDHAEIALGDGIKLAGKGRRRASFESFDELVKAWRGEQYWYWARRVLRKLRHGVRRANKGREAFAGEGETPAILLMEPQLADNIGMVARAMGNFGLDDLRLIRPRDGWPNEKARIAASGANYVIDDTQVDDSLDESVRDLNWVVATTARQRDMRKQVLTPEQAGQELSRRIAAGQRCGVLFGREKSGLTSDEVANCDAIVMIPVNSRFASLNLAQSVLILGYEWMLTRDERSLGRVTTYEKPVRLGFQYGSDVPAPKVELQRFFEHLEQELEAQGFFRPPERRPATVRALRTMFQRMGATRHEVNTLRGIVATLTKRRKGRGHGSI